MSIRIDLPTIPESPGVYLFKDSEGKVLYVGKAASLRARLSQYKPGQVEVRKEGLLERAVDVEVILTETEKEALLLEITLIKKHRPKYNVTLADDKRYPYLLLSDGEWPRVAVVRDVRAKGRLFGPFPDAGAAWETLATMREAFRIRDCKELIPGGCLNYQMRLCWGPCIPDMADRRRKTEDRGLSDIDVKAEYGRSVQEAEAFLRGDAERLTKQLQHDMEDAASRTEFERAALMRDRMRAVTTTLSRQAVFAGGREDRDAFACHREGGDWVGVVVLLRSGRISGQETYFFRKAAADNEAELLSEFIRRYYEHLPVVPKEVLTPTVLPDASVLEQWLSEKRGSAVHVRVPQRGELLPVLAHAKRNAEFRLAQMRLKRGEADSERELRALADALGLDEPPRRIECFDISHLSGTEVVASMSVLVDARARPSEYRRFKISQDKNDDFAAMQEVVHRRYSRLIQEGKPMPGLVLIDGGRGQLNAAKAALVDLGLTALPVASLAKREEEVFVPGLLRPLPLTRRDEAVQPLIRARDEAHRFAVDYQRKRRAKKFTKSSLDDVPGLGPAKKRSLLAHFGSVEEVLAARAEDLERVPGIGPRLARTIAGRVDESSE